MAEKKNTPTFTPADAESVANDAQSGVTGETGAVAILANDSGEAGVTTLSTFATDSWADKKRAYVAIDSAKSLRDEKMLEKEFVLTNVATISAQFPDEETGEIQDTTRVIMETEDGTSYYMFSDPLAGSVRQLVSAFGHPSTWEEPLTVKVTEGRTRKGFSFYKMDVVL